MRKINPQYSKSNALSNLYIRTGFNLKRSENSLLKKFIEFLNHFFYHDHIKFYLDIYKCKKGFGKLFKNICFTFVVKADDKILYDSSQMKLKALHILIIIITIVKLSFDGHFDKKEVE